jgi:predicted ATPase
MKIEQLKLENFKCFKTEKTFDFGRLTILTGANSSGKSTVMQAILTAIQSDSFPFSISPNGQFVNLGDFKNITYKKNKNLLKLGFRNGNDFVETAWLENKINFLPSLQTLKFYKDDKLAMIMQQNQGDKYDYEFLFETKGDAQKVYNILKSYPSLKNIVFQYTDEKLSFTGIMDDCFDFIYTVHGDLEMGRMNHRHDIELNFIRDIFHLMHWFSEFSEMSNYIGAFRQPPLRTNLEENRGDFKLSIDGKEFIHQIVEWDKRQNGKITQLVAGMKQMDLLKEVKIKRLSGSRFEILVKPTNSSFLTPLVDVGFGVSQFLPIIVADLQLPNNSTLFLAEPEIHLHPSVQSKFGQYIVNQVNTTDKNYIIETHSEYFLNRIRLAIVKGELKKSDVKVYFLENTKKDTDVYDIDFTKTGEIQNAPSTFFETYSMDVMDIALNSFNE